MRPERHATHALSAERLESGQQLHREPEEEEDERRHLDDLEGLSEVDQIKRLVDEYYDFVAKNIYSVKFLLGLILREEKHPDDVVGRMSELQRVYANLLANILESGRQKGMLRETVNPTLDAGLILSALHGLLVQGFMERDAAVGSRDLLQHLKAMLVDTLRRESSPPT